MEKLVVFPLNNDTEILIKGLKENKLYQVVAVSSYIKIGVGLNYYKRRVRYIVVQNLKNVLLELMLLFFQKIQWDIVMTDTKKECKWH